MLVTSKRPCRRCEGVRLLIYKLKIHVYLAGFFATQNWHFHRNCNCIIVSYYLLVNFQEIVVQCEGVRLFEDLFLLINGS